MSTHQYLLNCTNITARVFIHSNKLIKIWNTDPQYATRLKHAMPLSNYSGNLPVAKVL